MSGLLYVYKVIYLAIGPNLIGWWVASKETCIKRIAIQLSINPV